MTAWWICMTSISLGLLAPMDATAPMTSEVLTARSHRQSVAVSLASSSTDQISTGKTWLITVNESDMVIAVTIGKTELGRECQAIYVRVLDGRDRNATQLGSVCGQQEANFTSSGSTLFVHLVQAPGKACPRCSLSITYWARQSESSVLPVVLLSLGGALFLAFIIAMFIKFRKEGREPSGVPDDPKPSSDPSKNPQQDHPPPYETCYANGSTCNGEAAVVSLDAVDAIMAEEASSDVESGLPSRQYAPRAYKTVGSRAFLSRLLFNSGLATVPELPEILNQTMIVEEPRGSPLGLTLRRTKAAPHQNQDLIQEEEGQLALESDGETGSLDARSSVASVHSDDDAVSDTENSVCRLGGRVESMEAA